MASNSQDTCIDAYLLAIPSNYDTTFMDAYLQAIVSNYDKLFRQLHLFRLAQKQLLQAIHDDASEGDLRAHLDSTLLNITDGANEEEEDLTEFTSEERENGEARLGDESPDMLARGRVYEKALREARLNTRIVKFLVTELEKDANVLDYLSLDLPAVRFHLFNRAQEQLLQAIRHDASEADLRAHLDSTLLKSKDGLNEEAELPEFDLGEGVLDAESLDMLVRGQVYEKALGEAGLNRRIQKFLVMELAKDANLIDYLSLNLPEARRVKIVCWAATCNFVHIVMALIHWTDEGDGEILCRVLTIAVEFGYGELVKRLTELPGVDVNDGENVRDFDDIQLRAVGKPIDRLSFSSDRFCFVLNYYAFRDRLAPINLAAKLGNVEVVNTLLACDGIDVNFALHWAVKMGHAEVVKAILNKEMESPVNATRVMTVDKSLIVNRPSYVTYTSFIRWDGLVVGPLYEVHFTPLQLASLYGHASVVKMLCDDEKGGLGTTIENDRGITALQIATEMKRDKIVKILTENSEVGKSVKRLYRDRQVHVDAANAILVGAALIASVTFAGWLTPPSGYSPFFGSASLDAGAPTPSGMYPSFVSVEGHPILKIFWVFNSLSFFFAIATLMVGATAARPPGTDTYIGVEVQSLRTSLRLAYALLTVSVACVMGAFTSAGFVVLPPIQNYTNIMQATVGISAMVVFIAWISSSMRISIYNTVFKLVTTMQAVVEQIYYQYDSIFDPILRKLLHILRLIKEKILID
jgi:ankyrin repeat protein